MALLAVFALSSINMACAGSQTKEDNAREKMRERAEEAHEDMDREMEERGHEMREDD
jgi:hypothetical protein